MESRIPKTNDQVSRQIRAAIGKLGTLQTASVKEYALRLNPDQTEKSIESILDGLRLCGGAFFTKYNICPQPGRKIDFDMAVAFWAFTLYALQAQERFFAADWPSSIIFKTEDAHPARITVCRSARADENLTALKNRRWDGVFHEIIVGVNLPAAEIEAGLLPKGDSLTFISFRSQMPLTDIPQLIIEGGAL